MKIFIKKIAIFLLVLNFTVIPLIACAQKVPDKEIEGVAFEDAMFAYTGKEHSLLVTGDLPEGVTATYENNTHKDYGMYETSCTLSGEGYVTKTFNAVMTIYYDDNGVYDESAYAYRNQLSDDTLIFSESEKAGTFPDGRTEVLLTTKESIEDESMTKGGIDTTFTSTINEVDVYYKTTEQLKSATSIEAPYEGNNGYLVLESKKVSNRNAYLSLKPNCTKEEFLEADYLEFYTYFDTKSNRENQPSSMTLFFVDGNSQLFSNDLGSWVYVKIPLDAYQAARSNSVANFKPSSGGTGVKSREDFYEYLCAGNPLLWVRATFLIDTKEDEVFKMYFTDLKLKVATPDEGHSKLRNNFTKLNETQYLTQKGKKVLKNVFPRYVDALNESDYVMYEGVDAVKMDIELETINKSSVNTLLNIMYVQVNPSKTYKQIKQYDALAVTMRIDTQNPNPYLAMVTVPTVYATETKTLARFSANKWVTFEIPIEYILRMYAYLEGTQIYETPGTAYIWSNYVQELFYLTYEVREFDATTQNYKVSLAKDIYNARAKENITKWTDYPSRRETHVPKIQGSWIQYPMTVYLKSLKLIKKATA